MCTTTLLNAATATFQQGANSYTGTADNHLDASAPTTTRGANVTVLTDGAGPIAHGLLMFTNIFGGGPGQVPLNATITSASLTLRTDNLGNPCDFHRMLVFWDENSTWNSMTAGLSADDVEMTSAIQFTINGAVVGQIDTVDVTATVQGWFAGTFPNYGWGSLPTGTDGWQYNSSEAATIANRPLLTIVYDAPCSAISIATHPASQMINEGGSVTFSVAVTGTDPTYQWFKGSSPIQDATNSFYTIPFVLRGDAGTYHVNVQNTCAPSNVDSQNATLTVINDETPPRVVCAYGSNDNLTVFVTFDEPVTNALSNTSYTITPVAGGDNLQVTNVAYADTTFTVLALTIEGSTPMAATAAYNLFVSGVDDRFNNTLISSPAIPIARFPTAVVLPIDATHIWRFNNPTSNVSLGTAWRATGYNDTGWSNGPALLGVETAALPEPLRTTFVGYVAGAVRTFYFRSHFNFADNPANAVLCLRTVIDDAAVFHLNGAEIFRLRMPAVYDYNTEGTGGAIGDAVYEGPFYVCVTNLVQGDNVLAVEVHQTGSGSSDIVMGVAVSALVPSLDPIVITQDPVGGTINEGDSFTFTVGFTGTNPRFQWYQNNNPIPDATNASYAIGCAPRTAAGQYHVVIQNDIPSSDTSADATLTVTPDNTAPRILCAYFGPNVGPSNTVIVVYSEVVTNGIDDVLGYAIQRADGGQPELSAFEGFYTAGTNNPCAGPSAGSTVMLVLHESTPREPGIAYTLTTGGIKDVFGNEMAGATVPIAGFPRLLFGIDGVRQWRYNDTGDGNLGTAWRAKTYNDSGWPSGAALFDAKKDTNNVIILRATVNGEPVNTHINLSNAAHTVQISAAYFRTHFNYSGTLGTVLLCFRPFVDDAAVYYLNGAEVLRTPRMPAGTISYGTLATTSVGDANFEGPFYVCVTNLMAGDNVLAVEVHQNSLTSSDITFGTELTVLQATPPSSLTISQSGGMVTLTWSGPGGSILQEAPTVTGTWSTSANQSQNQTFAAGGTMRFFRVRE
jgi:hypothetical protein